MNSSRKKPKPSFNEETDSKNSTKLKFLKCLRSKAKVEVENVDYLLKGRKSVLLSDLPDWWFSHETYEFEYLPGVLTEQGDRDPFDLKIVNTFSLASNDENAKQKSTEILGKNGTKILTQNPIPKSPQVIDVPSASSPRKEKISHAIDPAINPSSILRKETNHDNPTDPIIKTEPALAENVNSADIQSIFSSSALDNMLAVESKALENKPLSLLEQLIVKTETIKYNTPTCQSSYVKTLQTALKERQHTVKVNNTESKSPTRHLKKKCLVLKPTYNLSRVRNKLQKKHGVAAKRGNAITAILSGLPNVLYKSRVLRTRMKDRRSMLQVITLSMADHTVAALSMVTSRNKLIKYNDQNIINNQKPAHATTSTKNIESEELNVLKRTLPRSVDLSYVKKRKILRNKFVQQITHEMAEFTVAALCSNNYYVALNNALPQLHMPKDPLSTKLQLNEKKPPDDKSNGRSTTDHSSSLGVAVSKYFIYQAKRHSLEKRCRDYKKKHFNNLPVALTKYKESRSPWKLKLSRCKLRWKENLVGDDIVVFPNSYTIPTGTETFVKSSDNTIESMTCARARHFSKSNKKQSSRSKRKSKHIPKKVIVNSSTEVTSLLNEPTPTSSLSDVRSGVMIVRLTHPNKLFTAGNESVIVKILSVCEWGRKAEEIMNTIIEGHNELQTMQRGKYIRTMLDDFLVEILRVHAGRVINDSMPEYIRRQLHISHWQCVSLVKISTRLNSNNSVTFERHINFGKAIQHMLVLDKKMSSKYSKDECPFDVKNIHVGSVKVNGDVSKRGKPGDSANCSSDSSTNSSNLNNLSKINFEKIVNNALQKNRTISTDKYLMGDNGRKFQVGRIGCLNKVTAPLFSAGSNDSLSADESPRAVDAPAHERVKIPSNEVIDLTAATASNCFPLPVLTDNVKPAFVMSQPPVPTETTSIAHPATPKANSMTSKCQLIQPKPVQRLELERNNFQQVLQNASISKPLTNNAQLAPAYIAVPVKVVPRYSESTNTSCMTLCYTSNKQVTTAQKTFQMILHPSSSNKPTNLPQNIVSDAQLLNSLKQNTKPVPARSVTNPVPIKPNTSKLDDNMERTCWNITNDNSVTSAPGTRVTRLRMVRNEDGGLTLTQTNQQDVPGVLSHYKLPKVHRQKPIQPMKVTTMATPPISGLQSHYKLVRQTQNSKISSPKNVVIRFGQNMKVPINLLMNRTNSQQTKENSLTENPSSQKQSSLITDEFLKILPTVMKKEFKMQTPRADKPIILMHKKPATTSINRMDVGTSTTVSGIDHGVSAKMSAVDDGSVTNFDLFTSKTASGSSEAANWRVSDYEEEESGLIIEEKNSDNSTRNTHEDALHSRDESSLRACDESSLHSRDESSVCARDESSLHSRDESSLNARDESSLRACDESSLNARDESSLNARDESSLNARDESSLDARDESSLDARDESSLRACDESSLNARDESSLNARDESSLNARDESSLNARDESSLRARDESSLRACDESSLRACDESSLRACDATISSEINSRESIMQSSQSTSHDDESYETPVNSTSSLNASQSSIEDDSDDIDVCSILDECGTTRDVLKGNKRIDVSGKNFSPLTPTGKRSPEKHIITERERRRLLRERLKLLYNVLENPSATSVQAIVNQAKGECRFLHSEQRWIAVTIPALRERNENLQLYLKYLKESCDPQLTTTDRDLIKAKIVIVQARLRMNEDHCSTIMKQPIKDDDVTTSDTSGE